MSTTKMLAAAVLCATGTLATLLAQSPSLPGASSAAGGPTFNKDVAPILYEHCTNCHRPGEIAPMSLLSYQEARPWARSIATRVASRSMPPWHADPAYGEFSNDRRLTDTEREVIARWVSGGAPEGKPSDLPKPPTYADGWMIGEPDAVLRMQEDYPLPAKGTVAYKYFEVPTNFTEDKWVQGFEVRPGNRSVVHHVIVYARPPARTPPMPGAEAETRSAPAPRPAPVFSFSEGMDIPAGQTGGPEPAPEQRGINSNDRPAPKQLGPSVGAYVPGNSNRIYSEGTALRLRVGSTLVFQMHYTPNGTDTTDRTSIGLLFAKAPPKIELRGAVLANGSLHIPAGSPNHRVDAEMTINQDVTLWSILPHTHVRGKGWSYEATYPDGRTETILAVPNYDFDWQSDYIFKQPLRLPKGTKLHASAWYDNSPGNKSNPDPTKDVWWGDQTWEEMMFTGLTVSIDSARPAPTAGAR